MLASYDLKSYANWDKNTLRANLELVTLNSIFGQFDWRTFRTFFGSFIRPDLEYGNKVLPPSIQKDKDAVELIQQRAKNLVRGFESKS